MRSLVLFAMTLALVASFAADASAFGKRKKKAAAAAVTYAAPAYDPCSCGGAVTYPHGHPSTYTVPSGPALMPGAVVPGTMPPK